MYPALRVFFGLKSTLFFKTIKIPVLEDSHFLICHTLPEREHHNKTNVLIQ
jgi:hypothetical protein